MFVAAAFPAMVMYPAAPQMNSDRATAETWPLSHSARARIIYFRFFDKAIMTPFAVSSPPALGKWGRCQLRLRGSRSSSALFCRLTPTPFPCVIADNRDQALKKGLMSTL
jgi:hypothetical protein